MIEGSTLHERIPAIGWLGLTIVAALASGCLSGARTGNMLLPNEALPAPPADFALSRALRISSVSDGNHTIQTCLVKVGTSEFRAALEQSLLSAGMLAPSPVSAKYLLEADLLEVACPENRSSADVTVTMTVDYRLKKASTSSLVWEYSITTPYTDRISDLWDGAKSALLADEGATRANIKELIDTLYQIGSARLDV